jgi:hypothetical protein
VAGLFWENDRSGIARRNNANNLVLFVIMKEIVVIKTSAQATYKAVPKVGSVSV